MNELSNVDWLPVAVGTIASFLVGWAWYSEKLFGKKWAEGSGVQLGSSGEMPVFAMVTQLIALALLAIVIGLSAAANALIIAIIAILTAAVFVTSNGAFSRKSNAAIAIDAFYVLISGVVMIVCQQIF